MTTDRDEVLEAFLEEAAERVQRINDDLVALEAHASGPDRGRLLDELLRDAHTLKSAARTVGRSAEVAIAHDLETLLQRVRADEAPGPLLAEAYRQADAYARAASGPPLPHGSSPPPPGATGGRPATHVPVAEPSPPQPESPPSAPAGPAGAARVRTEDTMRIGVAKVEALLSVLERLLTARLALERRARAGRDVLERAAAEPALPLGRRRELAELAGGLEAAVRELAGVAGELDAAAGRLRMVPVAGVFEPLPRLVRDLAVEAGKQVSLALAGGDTEADRMAIEVLAAPLAHLVRNAVQHGIEAPEAREANGKDPVGTLAVSVSQSAASLVIEVADDGSGIDPAAVRRAAVDRGVLPAEAAGALDAGAAVDLVFLSGVSTAGELTELAGRGVGLDVVRDAIDQLRGTVSVASDPGHGTTFRLTLPASIGARPCLLVAAHDRRYAVPLAALDAVVPTADHAGDAAGRRVLRVAGDVVALRPLHEALGDPAPAGGVGPFALVVNDGGERAAYAVDGIEGVCELVVRQVPAPLGGTTPGIAGAAILGGGEAVAVVNTAELPSARAAAAMPVTEPAAPPAEPPRSAPLVLVAEDSITSRALERRVLEAAGYRVAVAGDGLEAWRLIQADPPDLVVTDVRMPGLDGIELTTRIRSLERLRDLPIVIVSALGSDDDRRRGVAAGADAYVVKGEFDQDAFLRTVGQLV